MNKRDLGKLMAELHDSLRVEINSLKTDITTAKRLKTNLETYFEQCQVLINKITNEETGIGSFYELAVSIKKQIEDAKTSADNSLESLAETVQAVQTNIQEMEMAYESFTEINDKITDEATGMEARLLNVSELESKINVAKTNADSYLTSISNTLTSVQTNIQEMEMAYESFTEINDKITDEEDGLEASLEYASGIKTDIEAVKTNADLLYKEIRKFRDDAANYMKEIGGLKDTASVAIGKIEDQHKQSVDLKTKIEEIYNIGTRGAHSNHFVERRNQLFWISIFWLSLAILLLGATLWLAAVYVMPLAETLRDPSSNVRVEVFLLRFSIITPTLFGVIYSLRQFSNDRRLYEKYAFKAISTYSAEASVATLARSIELFKDDDKDAKIIDFAVNTFTSIYQEPIEPMRDRWIIKGGNKLLDLTAEVNQSVGEIKKDVDKLADKA